MIENAERIELLRQLAIAIDDPDDAVLCEEDDPRETSIYLRNATYMGYAEDAGHHQGQVLFGLVDDVQDGPAIVFLLQAIQKLGFGKMSLSCGWSWDSVRQKYVSDRWLVPNSDPSVLIDEGEGDSIGEAVARHLLRILEDKRKEP